MLGILAAILVFGVTKSLEYYFKKPWLQLYLPSKRPNLVKSDSPRATYYHVLIKNWKPWTRAINTAIYCTAVEVPTADNSTFDRQIVPRMRLSWPYEDQSKLGSAYQRVSSEIFCDLLKITADQKIHYRFQDKAGSIREFLSSTTTIKLHLIAVADNYESPRPTVFQISWNGKWSDNPDEMKRYSRPR
jgi:hypothetical protein